MGKAVFLDMDPGIDDAAELIAVSAIGDWEIVGVGTVAGNVDVDLTTRNALIIREAVGGKFKVFRGASRPLVAELRGAAHVHGSDGLGDSGLSLKSGSPERASAPEALAELAESGEVTLIATGPLTNVAIAALLRPEVAKRVRVYVMGGAFGLTEWSRGNVTPHAEFNFWQDPEAANVVFSAFSDVRVMPLDLTLNPAFWIYEADVSALKETPRSALLRKVLRFPFSKFGRLVPHDPMAAMMALDESRFVFRDGCVSVFPSIGELRGKSFLYDGRGCRHHRVAVSGDPSWFRGTFLGLMEL